LCSRYDTLLIADEVATGFGRTGRLFACEHAGVTPDIMCLAKGLTGGTLPMAVTVVNDSVYGEFCGEYGTDRIFNHGHSFTGNPIAASAACAALSVMLEQDIPGSIGPVIANFTNGLQRFRQFDIVGDIRSIGMMGALELDSCNPLVSDTARRIPDRICHAAIKRGLVIRPLGNVLYFVPALTITAAQTEEMFSLFEAAITDAISDADTDF
jgi:adenosylmethionine-8-amino-7-oxononanoate aminotransferase